ncbi:MULTISPECIES: DUF2381 family protein [unclassified Myxococcus]|uniref:DUF2381 family protein n=1 Tax=unclassified Myxococcus TaxID=2648731 RepID=UPI001E4E9041|nr:MULTISPECIES: DUF2381 family protein [unclassified Myxococcus]
MWGAAVQAEPSAAVRMRRKWVVTVPSAAAEPSPVVHVAHDTPTLLLISRVGRLLRQAGRQ